MPESIPTRILIVDDEAAHLRALCDTLRDHGYDTYGFSDGESALQALKQGEYELLLADMMMPGIDGITLLREARLCDSDLASIIMTGEGTIASAVEAMKSGAMDYILKPFKLSAVLPVLSRALTMRRLRIENAELEHRLRQRTSELEENNRDLEAFSYSISHDLRSPLLSITCSSELMLDAYAAQMPPAALELVDIVLKSAKRMAQLIDDMLRLAHLGNQPVAMCPVDVSLLVREILEELQGPHRERQIDIRVHELLDTVGDPGLLKQVFANLLSNSYKFTRERENPVIEISSRQEGDEKIYSVRDNGAGFDMHRARDLFGAFQRYHSPDQYEGTGIGLSIAHRIIQRHGGRIWAESEVDNGATFHFSLPG